MFLRHGGPRHEVSEPVGEGDEGSGEPVVRVDVGQLTVFDEDGDHRPVVSAHRTGKERVLAVQSDSRIDRSTVFVSRSMRPSSRKWVSPFQRPRA